MTHCNYTGEILAFATTIEEGPIRQKLYGERNMTIKSEPMWAINKKKNCLRSGMENFTMELLKTCRAKKKQGNK